MKLRGLNDYDVINYKLPSMFLIFPYCSFKCDKENHNQICQNSKLIQEPIIEVEPIELVFRYVQNPLTRAVVCGGLEPFDSWDDLIQFITLFRGFSSDPVVIYTGYNQNEIENYIKILQKFDDIIVKFGRFIPKSLHIYDSVLGVELASDNQYALELKCDEYLPNNGGENTYE